MPQTQERSQRPQPGDNLQRTITDIALRQIDEAQRTVELSFSSETPVTRWFGDEILCHDEGVIDMSRLLEMGVVLFNHDTGIPLGRVIKAEIDSEEKKCRATVQFDDESVSDWYFQKVLSGTLKGVSVGYRVSVWETVAANATSTNGRFQGPCDVAMRWTPYEISIVSVPADASVGVGRSADEDSVTADGKIPEAETREKAEVSAEKSNAERREVIMLVKDPTKETAATEEERQQVVIAEQGRASTPEEIDAERTRCSEITSLCREFKVESTDQDTFIREGTSVDQVRKHILDQQMKNNEPLGRAQVVSEPIDHFRDAAPHAILMRAGMNLESAGIEKPHEAARGLRHMTIRAMMEECLRLQGVTNASRMAPHELMKRALTPDSQFASILDNTIGHSLLIGHTETQTTFQVWTGRGTLTNFKPTPSYRDGAASLPEEILQNGEFTWSEEIDQGVFRQLHTFGKKWGFTLQAMIDDDLDVLTKRPRLHAAAYRRLINKSVYDIINNNAAVAWDGELLFSVAHGNLGTGAIPSVSSLDAGFQAMMAQTDISGEAVLNIVPRFLLMGIAVAMTGEQLIASLVDPSGTNSNVPNPGKIRALIPVTDAMISDTNSWDFAADPNSIDTIQVDYLNGDDQMIIETLPSWDRLGIEWRGYGHFGVTALDHRGLYHNPGVS